MNMLGTLDAYITGAINHAAGHLGWFDSIMIGITYSGIPLLILAVAVTWWIGPGPRRSERHAAVSCGLSFLLGLAINQGILQLVHRMRPYDAGVTHLIIDASADPSFPSDHATAAFSIIFGYLSTVRYRKAMFFLICGLVISYSRVYVGTHYVSDIMGGVATALVATLIVRATYKENSRVDRWITGLL